MKNYILGKQAHSSSQKSPLNPLHIFNSRILGKNYIYLMLIASIALFSACSAQSRLSTRLTDEWTIEKFEVREVDKEPITTDNAGTITFHSNGEGIQSFTTAIASGGQSADSEFQWKNTARTVTINASNAEYPKVWIVVKSQTGTQEWYSTDSMGNVQIMYLRKK